LRNSGGAENLIQNIENGELGCYQSKDGCAIVIVGDFVLFGYSAPKTTMNYVIFLGFALSPNWLHHTATVIASVARDIINMLTPKTFGAMIGVASAFHLKSAMFTNKILEGSNKVFSKHPVRNQPGVYK